MKIDEMDVKHFYSLFHLCKKDIKLKLATEPTVCLVSAQ